MVWYSMPSSPSSQGHSVFQFNTHERQRERGLDSKATAGRRDVCRACLPPPPHHRVPSGGHALRESAAPPLGPLGIAGDITDPGGVVCTVPGAAHPRQHARRVRALRRQTRAASHARCADWAGLVAADGSCHGHHVRHAGPVTVAPQDVTGGEPPRREAARPRVDRLCRRPPLPHEGRARHAGGQVCPSLGLVGVAPQHRVAARCHQLSRLGRGGSHASRGTTRPASTTGRHRASAPGLACGSSATACGARGQPRRGARAERRGAPGAPCGGLPRPVGRRWRGPRRRPGGQGSRAAVPPPTPPAWRPPPPEPPGARPWGGWQHPAAGGESPRPASRGPQSAAPTPPSREHCGSHRAWRARPPPRARAVRGACRAVSGQPAALPRPRSLGGVVVSSRPLQHSGLAWGREALASAPRPGSQRCIAPMPPAVNHSAEN